jgi:hypothetical protein
MIERGGVRKTRRSARHRFRASDGFLFSHRFRVVKSAVLASLRRRSSKPFSAFDDSFNGFLPLLPDRRTGCGDS